MITNMICKLGTYKFFVDFKYLKDNNCRVMTFIIFDNKFWNEYLIVVELMGPCVCSLRIV